MIQIYKKIFSILEDKERKFFIALMLVMLLVAVAEVFGIGTVFVLLKVLSNPENIFNNEILNWVYKYFDFDSINYFQLMLSLVVLTIVVAGLAIKAFGTYLVIRFSNMRGYEISKRLLENYMFQPYEWILQKNTSDVTKSVLSEVDRMINSVFIPSLRLLSNIMLAIIIILFLLWVEPIIAVIAALLIGGGYFAVYTILRGKLLNIGHVMIEANQDRFHLTQEMTGGFKEVKLLGLEQAYIKRFSKPAARWANSSSLRQLISELPRFLLEALTIGTLLGIVLYLLITNNGDITAIVPTLGVFAFAALRMLPAVQQAYYSLSAVRSGQAVLEHLCNEFSIKNKYENSVERTSSNAAMSLNNEIYLSNVSFTYPVSEVSSLNNICLKIKAGNSIGIVGGTGAGKTTLVDIILGLLQPSSGYFYVDGEAINNTNVRAWQRTIGYVPQSIFLVDATIYENVAFGVPKESIDMTAVMKASKAAALDEFIHLLPSGYETQVGERGVRLSGGQRQRIGIARALYHNPSLLIMDEATSALDNITEKVVMDAVQNIKTEKTIILIAHRLSTVMGCDQIILMDKGVVSDIGTYAELLEKNERFKEMAGGL